MRLVVALAAVALMAAIRPGWASAEGISITVDKVYAQGAYINAISRIANHSPRNYNRVRFVCDFYSSDSTAFGSTNDFVDNVEAGKTVVGNSVTTIPPNTTGQGVSATCRIRSTE